MVAQSGATSQPELLTLGLDAEQEIEVQQRYWELS
jgi:hypothetical protein